MSFLSLISARRSCSFAYRQFCAVRGYDNKVHSFDVEKTPITAQLWQRRKEAQGAIASAIVSTAPKVSISTTIPYTFSNEQLRDLYVDMNGQVLLGKLLEDFDSIAGNIAFEHCFNVTNQHSLSLVTAAVDYIKLQKDKSLDASVNYDLRGRVIWVGKSSLDVLVELHEASVTGQSAVVLSSVFTYVARDKITKKSQQIVNKLLVESVSDVELFNDREEISKQKKLTQQREATSEHLLDIPRDVLLQLLNKGRSVVDLPSHKHNSSRILISSTTLENCFITQPQNVNTAGKVFGGLLMHRAYDLALATSYTFATVYPTFREVAEILFKHPVEVGDLVRLKSRVVCTKNTGNECVIHVEVTSQIVKMDQGHSIVSNTFDFIFSVESAKLVDGKLKDVVPVTVEEVLVHVKALNHSTECEH